MRDSVKRWLGSGGGIGAAIFTAAAWAGGAPAATATPANLAACFEAQAARLPFSGVVMAVHGDEEFFRTSGALGPDGGTPQRDTPYLLSSVTKVLTAVAIGQLVDQGRIALDATVGTYLPDLPAHLAQVTIEQLLQHRGGVAPMTELTPEYVQALRTATTARQLVPLVASRPPAFSPGERQGYSNGGYMLLGAVIEAVTGRSYAEHLEQSLFVPLGMTASRIEMDARTAPPMSRLLGPGGPAPSPQSLAGRVPPRGTPAGNSVSSAADLARLGRALLGDELLRPETKARIFPRNGEVWRIGQAGGSPGSNADLAVLPDHGWVVVTLSNYDPPAGQVMGEVLRGVALGRGCHTLSEQDRPSPLRILPPRTR
ncbi:MAG: beta-lactamase family protein [Pseudomonadota bacterium]|nr:beta-lactamase family protein [Pseudomonadota bacterium]